MSNRFKQAGVTLDVQKRSRNVRAPVAMTSVNRQQPPRSVGSNRGDRIVHSELIGNVSGSIAFEIAFALAINPGLNASFPWLSVQASRWQQYRFHRLHFRYVNRTSTLKIGSIMMATEYNAATAAPADEAALLAMRDAVDGSPWTSLDHKVDTSSMNSLGSRRYIRTTNVPGDIKTYDVGTLYLASKGQTDTAEVGKLFVDYDVELFNPVIANPTLQPKCFALFYNAAPINFLDNVAGNIACPDVSINSIGITYAAGIYTVPAGTYLIHAQASTTNNDLSTYQNNLRLQKDGVDLLGCCSITVSSPNNIASSAFIGAMAYVSSTIPFTARALLLFSGITAGTTWAVRAETGRIMFHCV